MIPPEERPTAAELAGMQQAFIAGQPAAQCPYCGCGMFVNRTESSATRIDRYEVCRNKNCGRRFITRQPPKVFVREVEPHESNEISSAGKETLSVYREAC